MRILKLLIASFFLLPLLVHAELTWTVSSMSDPAHQHHGRPKQVLNINNMDARLWLYTPDGQRRAVESKGGQVSLRATGKNNYHLYLAEYHQGTVHEVALYYRHMSGKPTGHSPGELVALQKHDFEIVPSPLPREHRRWLSGKPVNFVLRFQGQPQAGITVVLQTSNGSRLQALSDAQGRVAFVLPDDFDNVKLGPRANAAAHLTLQAEIGKDGQQYRTSLTHPYSVNPTLYWQSMGMGWWLLAGGFVFGLGLVQYKNNNKESAL